MKHVGGVFLVLFVGIGFSFAFTLFELVWEVAVKSIKENVSEQKKKKKKEKYYQRVYTSRLSFKPNKLYLLFFFFFLFLFSSFLYLLSFSFLSRKRCSRRSNSWRNAPVQLKRLDEGKIHRTEAERIVRRIAVLRTDSYQL